MIRTLCSQLLCVLSLCINEMTMVIIETSLLVDPFFSYPPLPSTHFLFLKVLPVPFALLYLSTSLYSSYLSNIIFPPKLSHHILKINYRYP